MISEPEDIQDKTESQLEEEPGSSPRKQDARRVEFNVALNPKQAQALAALKIPTTEAEWLANDANPEVIDVLFGGSKGPGKLQSMTSKVLTPKGWSTMGDMHVGSVITDPTTGGSCRVVQVFPQGVVPIYKVTFDDGSSTEAGLEHLWAYHVPHRTREGTKPSSQRSFSRAELGVEHTPTRWSRMRVGTTAEMLKILKSGLRPRIPLAEPVLFTVNGRTATGPLPAYLLGLLLGDGHCETKVITNVDAEIIDYLTKLGFSGNGKEWRAHGEIRRLLHAWLVNHGLLKCLAWDKFIPPYVLTAPIEYRLDFLRGLMDSDGTVDNRGEASFCSTSPMLAQGVQDLVRSLGGKAWWRERHPTYTYKGETRTGRTAYEVRIQANKVSAFFKLSRKKSRCPNGWNGGYEIMRAVESIEYVGDKEAQCIRVSSPHGLYVTDDFIVTHNSFDLVVSNLIYAISTIRFFELEPARDVPHIAWMGRKISAVFTATTLETWKSVIPSEYYTIVSSSEKHPKHIRILDRVAIDFGGLDNQHDLERFNSAEYGMSSLDQAEETKADDVATLKASRRKKLYHKRLRRHICLPYRGLWTANPRACWLKDRFIDHPGPNQIFVSALPSDNRHLPQDYVKTLEDAFAHRPDLLRAYRDGYWDDLSGIDQVILQSWIAAAKRRFHNPPYTKRLVSVDPARFGNDSTTILGLENWSIIAGKKIPYSPSTQVSYEAASMSTALGDVPIVVETSGLGGPIADECRAMGKNVIDYDPASGSDMPSRYVNLRAQVFSEVGRGFCTGVFDVQASAVICLPEPEDENLREIYESVCKQLTWYSYDFRGSKTLIASKEDIKSEHNGQSPDDGDAYVQGVWHQRYVEPGVYSPVFAVAVPQVSNYVPQGQRRQNARRTAWSC